MADLDRIGPYLLMHRLGTGGMGEVFLAHDERLERRVAIKRMRGGHDVSAHRRRRFRREATIAAKLNHPAIVHIYDVLQAELGDCIVMEYVEGENLRQRIAAGPLSISKVLVFAHQIALGMAEAHDQGIVHRDLKSENILITGADQVKITDFGIAKLHGEEPLAEEGSIVGTYRSMSPEQALGRAVDHRSDLFSFGILLYESLTGTSPFYADTPFLTLQRIVHSVPEALVALAPSTPPALIALVNQLLNKIPRLRPRDFREVADALAELMGKCCMTSCPRRRERSNQERSQQERPVTDHHGQERNSHDQRSAASTHRDRIEPGEPVSTPDSDSTTPNKR